VAVSLFDRKWDTKGGIERDGGGDDGRSTGGDDGDGSVAGGDYSSRFRLNRQRKEEVDFEPHESSGLPYHSKDTVHVLLLRIRWRG